MRLTQPSKVYRENDISTASQGKLIVMLYDGCIQRLKEAEAILGNSSTSEYDAVNNALGGSQAILTELSASLDFDQGGEIARNLYNLYEYFSHQLTNANLTKDAAPVKEVREHMEELRVSWSQVQESAEAKKTTKPKGINITG